MDTKFKLIFSRHFVEDLDNAFEYICKVLDSPLAAKKLMSKIDKSILRTIETPFIYPLCPQPLNGFGLRKIVVDKYIVVYSVDEDKKTVNMLRMFYGKQNYTNYFWQD